jgi:type IV conjugative transfer system lipoprotein TraV
MKILIKQKSLIITLILSSFLLSSCASNVSGSWSCKPLVGKTTCGGISDSDVINSSNDETKQGNKISSYLDSKQKIEIKLIAPKLSALEKKQYLESIKNQSANNNATLIGAPMPENFQDLTTNSTIIKDLTSNNSQNLRSQEKIGRIWFAPFIDSDGNQHLESIVYVVDEEPKWLNQTLNIKK